MDLTTVASDTTSFISPQLPKTPLYQETGVDLTHFYIFLIILGTLGCLQLVTCCMKPNQPPPDKVYGKHRDYYV